MRRLLLALLLLLTGCSSGGPLPPQADVVAADLVDRLRDGGYVLLLRHAETTRGGIDSLDTLGDCDAQRPLSDDGREQARALGEAVRALGVPIGRVVASPFCRTVETAELAFGRTDTDPALLALASTGAEGSPEQERTLTAARALAAQPPAPGTNTVLVGHVSTFLPLSGVSPEEGGTVVVRPDGDGGLETVGELSPGVWSRLAERPRD